MNDLAECGIAEVVCTKRIRRLNELWRSRPRANPVLFDGSAVAANCRWRRREEKQKRCEDADNSASASGGQIQSHVRIEVHASGNSQNRSPREGSSYFAVAVEYNRTRNICGW